MCLIFLFYFHLELGKDLFDFILFYFGSELSRKKNGFFGKENGYGMEGYHEFFC